MATVETGLQELLSPETGSPTTFICRHHRSTTPPVTPDSTPEGSVIIIDLEQKAIQESIQSARAKKGLRRESTSSNPDCTLGNESPQEAERPSDVDEDLVLVDSGVDSEPERISENLGRQLNAVITQAAGWPRLRIERLLDAQQLLLVLTSVSAINRYR